MTDDQVYKINEQFSTQEEQFTYWGRYHGYPECCIELFLQESHKDYWFKRLPWHSARSLKMDGYIPCEKCANLPRQTLVDDINSRRKVDKIK